MQYTDTNLDTTKDHCSSEAGNTTTRPPLRVTFARGQSPLSRVVSVLRNLASTKQSIMSSASVHQPDTQQATAILMNSFASDENRSESNKPTLSRTIRRILVPGKDGALPPRRYYGEIVAIQRDPSTPLSPSTSNSSSDTSVIAGMFSRSVSSSLVQTSYSPLSTSHSGDMSEQLLRTSVERSCCDESLTSSSSSSWKRDLRPRKSSLSPKSKSRPALPPPLLPPPQRLKDKWTVDDFTQYYASMNSMIRYTSSKGVYVASRMEDREEVC